MVIEEDNIRDVIVSMKYMFSMRALKRKIDLIFDIDKLIPEKFFTDSQKVR